MLKCSEWRCIAYLRVITWNFSESEIRIVRILIGIGIGIDLESNMFHELSHFKKFKLKYKQCVVK